MKNGLAVFLAFLAFVQIGQSSEKNRDSDRIAIKNEWINAAAEVARKTGDEEALVLVKNLLASTATAAFLPDGFRTIEIARFESRSGMYLIPVMKEDSGSQKTVVLGYFLGGPRLIFIPEITGYNETMKGIILLQETRFAVLLLSNGVAADDTDAIAKHRQNAVDFGRRLISKISNFP